MRDFNLTDVNIQFEDFGFTEEELEQERMKNLIELKYNKLVENMFWERFTVKIGWFGYAKELKYGE